MLVLNSPNKFKPADMGVQAVTHTAPPCATKIKREGEMAFALVASDLAQSGVTRSLHTPPLSPTSWPVGEIASSTELWLSAKHLPFQQAQQCSTRLGYLAREQGTFMKGCSGLSQRDILKRCIFYCCNRLGCCYGNDCSRPPVVKTLGDAWGTPTWWHTDLSTRSFLILLCFLIFSKISGNCTLSWDFWTCIQLRAIPALSSTLTEELVFSSSQGFLSNGLPPKCSKHITCLSLSLPFWQSLSCSCGWQTVLRRHEVDRQIHMHTDIWNII